MEKHVHFTKFEFKIVVLTILILENAIYKTHSISNYIKIIQFHKTNFHMTKFKKI